MRTLWNSLTTGVCSFFEECPRKLNLPSLCSLLESTITANENNLKYSSDHVMRGPGYCNMLRRMSQLLTSTSNRPLIHQMHAWTTAKEHLIEVADKFLWYSYEMIRLLVLIHTLPGRCDATSRLLHARERQGITTRGTARIHFQPLRHCSVPGSVISLPCRIA